MRVPPTIAAASAPAPPPLGPTRLVGPSPLAEPGLARPILSGGGPGSDAFLTEPGIMTELRTLALGDRTRLRERLQELGVAKLGHRLQVEKRLLAQAGTPFLGA